MAKNNVAAQIMDDLVHKAKYMDLLSSTYTRKGNPGDIILGLGPVKRQLLKELKSEDISDIRPDSFL